MKRCPRVFLPLRDAVDLELDHFAVEQAENGMERAHPAEFARAPAHRFRPGEALDDVGHDLGHDLGGGAAALLDRRYIISALLVVALLGLIDGSQPRRFEEALDGGFGSIDARTLLLLAHIGRAGRQAVDHRRQPARRGEGLYVFIFETRLGQLGGEQARQILARAGLHPRRDLLGE